MRAARLILLALATMLFLASPAVAKPTKAPPKLGGKAFITADAVKDLSADALGRQFGNAPAQGTLARGKSTHWIGTLVAFFKKPSVQGPVVVWIFDKADKQALKDNEPVQAVTFETTPSEVFVHEIDFDPDQGYNKDRVYLLRVGQIISGKPKIYSTGEVKLLK